MRSHGVVAAFAAFFFTLDLLYPSTLGWPFNAAKLESGEAEDDFFASLFKK